jgi:hypothetical protein
VTLYSIPNSNPHRAPWSFLAFPMAQRARLSGRRKIAAAIVGFRDSVKRHPNRLLSTPKARLRVAYEKCEPGSLALLINNIRRQPAWQEIVDFS